MDLPPPSYESATGQPGLHNQKNPYFKSVSPTAPPPLDDEITTAESVTAPIFPRPYRSNHSPNVEPNNQNSDPETTTSPKTKTIYLYRNREEKCPPCVWFFIIFIFVVCALIVIIGLIRAKNKKSNYDSSPINENPYNEVKEYQDKWWKENQQMIQDIQDRATRVLEDRRNNPYLGNNN